MDVRSRFLLQFLYALQNCFARVEAVAFDAPPPPDIDTHDDYEAFRARFAV